MAEDASNRSPASADDLSPALRRAVENVIAEEPPDGAMRRTLNHLRLQRPVDRSTWPRFGAVAAALAVAAGIAFLLVIGGPWTDHSGQGPRVVIHTDVQPPLQPRTDLPTLWAYHRAAQASLDEVDELLDRHAARVLALNSEPVRIGAMLSPGGGSL